MKEHGYQSMGELVGEECWEGQANQNTRMGEKKHRNRQDQVQKYRNENKI